MTLLEIDLKDVLSETDPDDRVIVWAPAIREGPSGALVGTRRKAIPLTDGVGSDEVVPGPLMVQVQCKGIADTKPREVVVPDQGPVTLTDLLRQTFTYTPPVVNEALTQITTARDNALADVDGAVDHALAGTQHYSGTGFPEGVVAAPVGSIYTDTAATAGAVRWIKASGTGNTGWRVEYGSTGVRDITSLIPDNDDRGRARISRTNNLATLHLVNVPILGTGTYVSLDGLIPEGFMSTFNWQYLAVGKPSGIDASGPIRVGTSSALIIYRATSETRVNASVVYECAPAWPTALPGTPA